VPWSISCPFHQRRRYEVPLSTIASKILRFSVPVAWTTAIIAGFWSLERYKSNGGRAEAISIDGLRSVGRAEEQSAGPMRLVMYVHPHCPCTRASLTELAKLVEAGGGRLTTEVVVVAEPGMDAGWKQGAIVRAAEALKGVRVRTDETGEEAARVGAYTSGHTVLFAADGTPLFCGGVTRSRGHEGESSGTRAIRGLLADSMLAAIAKNECLSAPVFGCALFRKEPCRDEACRVATTVE